jgi:hypothetical protein
MKLRMFSLKLREVDLQKIRDNLNTTSRKALAKELRITKLQLNHVMNGMKSKKGPSWKKLDA